MLKAIVTLMGNDQRTVLTSKSIVGLHMQAQRGIARNGKAYVIEVYNAERFYAEKPLYVEYRY